MSHHIRGQGRSQVTLFPEALDDFISAENPIRVIDVFVDELDLVKLGFKRAIPEATGRPGYDPATLLKLYVYGYLNRIQSSRRLEREAQRNVELMWLVERLTPDFKTIADFRKDNGQGLKNTCRTFVELCRNLNLFADAMVAIDGSKFKAVNNKENNFTPKKLQFHIARVEKHIDEYLAQLDKSDEDEKEDQPATSMSEKINWLKQRLVELKDMEKAVNSHPDKQVSTTDADSRLMKTQGMTRMVCYNVQSAVDIRHHLIVAHEVTNTPDRGQLCKVAKQVKAALGAEDTTVIADKGYYSRQDIKDTQDEGMTALVPKGDTSGAEKKGIFNRSLFNYDKDKDVYICPAGSELQYRCNTAEDGLTLKMYFNNKACSACGIRSQCTTSKRDPRKMKRWIHEEEMEAMQAKLDANPKIMLSRKQTVEHPFGTIKSWMGATHFLTKGFKNVSTEMNLHVLAYNLKRVMNILGVEPLMQAIRA